MFRTAASTGAVGGVNGEFIHVRIAPNDGAVVIPLGCFVEHDGAQVINRRAYAPVRYALPAPVAVDKG